MALPPSVKIELAGEPIPVQIVMFGQRPSLEAPDDGEAMQERLKATDGAA